MGFPFTAHVALLEQFLSGRRAIVEGLERQLFSVRGKANARNGDRESIAEVFQNSFFESAVISPSLSGLNRQLEAAHLADGFEPARQDGYSRALDPVELVLRACDYWETTRWPGTNGRLLYAQSLYAAFILNQLEHLSLRIWDEGNDQAAERLQQVQRLLDLLNAADGSARRFRPLRDARWLIQTAQGPLTRHIKPYFTKASQVAALEDAGLEAHKAGAVLAGGHLRSQLRHLSWRTGWALDDPRLLALTRSSNSMDMALLVRDLVPLLDAYQTACARQEVAARLVLSDAILQGLSSDPELMLTRLDLLAPSTMIEDLFVAEVRGGASSYSAMGEEHHAYLARYADLLAGSVESLRQDSRALAPVLASYSPLGIVYGFCADLFSNMVLSTLRAPASSDVSIEEMFVSRDRLEEKRTQAHEWQRLPKRAGERDPFEHSTEWAEQMFGRLAAALEARAAHPHEPNASTFSKSYLYVFPSGVSRGLSDGVLPADVVRAQEHSLTSDAARARDTGATVMSADRMAADRAEGRFLACAYVDGTWFGVSKMLLTMCASQGKDAVITDVPPAVFDLLRVTCPQLVVVAESA